MASMHNACRPRADDCPSACWFRITTRLCILIISSLPSPSLVSFTFPLPPRLSLPPFARCKATTGVPREPPCVLDFLFINSNPEVAAFIPPKKSPFLPHIVIPFFPFPSPFQCAAQCTQRRVSTQYRGSPPPCHTAISLPAKVECSLLPTGMFHTMFSSHFETVQSLFYTPSLNTHLSGTI